MHERIVRQRSSCSWLRGPERLHGIEPRCAYSGQKGRRTRNGKGETNALEVALPGPSGWATYRSDFAGTSQDPFRIARDSPAGGFCLSRALSERLWRFGINRTERLATYLPGWPNNLSFACNDADRAHKPGRWRFQFCSFPAQE